MKQVLLFVICCLLSSCGVGIPYTFHNSLGHTVTWERNAFPIAVYLSDDLTSDQRGAALEAVDGWNNALRFQALYPSGLSVEAVQTRRQPCDHCVYVIAEDIPDEHYPRVTQGQTNPFWMGDHFLSDIVYIDHNCPIDSLNIVMMHEFGHVLGLEHYPTDGSVMYYDAASSSGHVLLSDIDFIRSEAGR